MLMLDQLSHRLSAVAFRRKTRREYRDAIGIAEIDWERMNGSHGFPRSVILVVPSIINSVSRILRGYLSFTGLRGVFLSGA